MRRIRRPFVLLFCLVLVLYRTHEGILRRLRSALAVQTCYDDPSTKNVTKHHSIESFAEEKSQILFPSTSGSISKKNSNTGSRNKIVFGIKSGAEEFDRRAAWRASHCAAYYRKHNIVWKFMVGRPMDPKGHILNRHDQGALDTEWERFVASRLLLEHEANMISPASRNRTGDHDDRQQSPAGESDMVFLPMRDQYMSLPDKTVGLLQHLWAKYPDTPYIGAHDIEYCINATVLQSITRNFEKLHTQGKYQALYAGAGMFQGTEYKMMEGADGKPEPYMSGNVYFFSRTLVGWIVNEDNAHTVLNGYYGSMSEDLNVGRFVAHASKKRRIKTLFAHQHKLQMNLEDMSLENME